MTQRKEFRITVPELVERKTYTGERWGMHVTHFNATFYHHFNAEKAKTATPIHSSDLAAAVHSTGFCEGAQCLLYWRNVPSRVQFSNAQKKAIFES